MADLSDERLEQLWTEAVKDRPDLVPSDIRELIGTCQLERAARQEAERERDEARQWVRDLQSGMYVNCVYCGHRYGPGETTPVSMADALKEHVERCPKHPMSALRARLERVTGALREIRDSVVVGEYPGDERLCAWCQVWLKRGPSTKPHGADCPHEIARAALTDAGEPTNG